MTDEAKKPYTCSQCGNTTYETGEISASGGIWSSLFDFDSERFSFVACRKCHHTRFYRTRLRNLSRVVDFLLS